MKANKGEWSEFYAFLKTLEDKKLFAANKNLEIIDDKFFIFKKIIRDETNQETKVYDLKESGIYILDSKGKVLKKVKTIKIFEKIKNAETTTFNLPEAEILMQELLCSQIKADNSKKSDIDGVIYDRVSNKEELLGFSVKSMIGGASTLLNAGKTTNFIYEITNLDTSKIDEINSIEGRSKIQDRLKSILENKGSLNFDKISKSDYEYKIKNFLVSVALGMVPSKVWDGFMIQDKL